MESSGRCSSGGAEMLPDDAWTQEMNSFALCEAGLANGCFLTPPPLCSLTMHPIQAARKDHMLCSTHDASKQRHHDSFPYFLEPMCLRRKKVVPRALMGALTIIFLPPSRGEHPLFFGVYYDFSHFSTHALFLIPLQEGKMIDVK